MSNIFDKDDTKKMESQIITDSSKKMDEEVEESKEISQNYNSNIMNGENSVNNYVSKSLKIVEKKSGKVFNVGNINTDLFLDKLNDMTTKIINSKNPWKKWWEKKKEIKNNLLSCIEKNDIKKIESLLNPIEYKELVGDVNGKYVDSKTLLHYCAQENNCVCAEVLLEESADTEARTSLKRTPLHFAALSNSEAVFKLLVDSGAKINVVDEDGNTPLHFLCEKGYFDLLVWFLEKNPDLTIKNKKGQKAIDVSVNKSILDLLNKYSGGKIKPEEYGSVIYKDSILHHGRSDMIQFYLNKFQNEQYPKRNKEEDKKHYLQKEKRQDVMSDSTENDEKLKFDKLTKMRRIARKLVKIKNEDEKLKNEVVNLNGKINIFWFNFKGILGGGAFGKVYLVELKTNNQIYAMKVIRKEIVFKDKIVKYVNSEKNVLVNARHPFIIDMLCSFQNSKYLFLVMEFCPCGDLKYLLRKIENQRMPEEIVRNYSAEVILAIEYLHSKNVIYRDLKPENLVVNLDGHVKLTDFGLSKEGMANLAKTYSFLGTENYLAPEMISKKGHGKALDWYLVGVLIFELTTGKVPHAQADRFLFKQLIETKEPNYPDYLSKQLIDLLKGLLKKDPNKRLGSGKNGVIEIKNHKWFASINWEDVIQKKLKLPIQKEKKVYLEDIDASDFIDQSNEYENIKNFSFSGEIPDN